MSENRVRLQKSLQSLTYWRHAKIGTYGIVGDLDLIVCGSRLVRGRDVCSFDAVDEDGWVGCGGGGEEGREARTLKIP